MKPFAYSIVFRNKDDRLNHNLGHCWAHSKQEAKGIAIDEFEENNADCRMMSVLIQAITKDENSEETTSETEEAAPEAPRASTFSDYVNPEFSFKNKF